MDFEKKILKIFAEKTFYLLRIPEINNEEKKRKRKFFEMKKMKFLKIGNFFFALDPGN